MPEDNSYQKKIQEILIKVSKGEQVFEKPVPINPLHAQVEKDGAKKVIEQIFTEGWEIPSFVTESEQDLDIDTSSYSYVSIPSSFAEADKYWNSLVGSFLRLGIPKNDGSKGYIDTTVNDSSNKEQTLRIRLVVDKNNGEKPSISFTYINGPTITPLEVSNLINKLGLKIDRTESKQIGNTIISDVV